MIIKANTKLFEKQMSNIIDYSLGFLDGVKSGQNLFLNNLGKGIVFALGQYIDIMAKSNPKALHHIYEWNEVGSPSARLFTLKYDVGAVGLTINSQFKQSRSMTENMTVPFYNKAKVMEDGLSVKIVPQANKPLHFLANGAEVFTKKTVTVNNPGGDAVAGSFEKTVSDFINTYLKQSFLRSSGLYDYIEKPFLYKKNIAMGAKTGKSKGRETGFLWISNASLGLE